MKKILIIGGGISGLTARYYLSKASSHLKITLFESSNRLGGSIETNKTPFFFEKGPRTFKPSRSHNLIALIKELGMEKDLVFSSKESNRRLIWKEGSLKSPFTFLNKFMGAIVKDLITSDLSKKDETIRAFIDRRFGSFIASNVFDPLTLGIYGGDINKLSVVSCFSHLKKLELEHASIIKGFIKSLRSKKANKSKGLFTLKNGMESLVKQLVDKGKGDIYLNSKIQFLPDGYDRYILALPSKEIQDLFYFDREIQDFFVQLESVNLFVVNIAFKYPVLKEKAFGYLIPSSEGEKALGVIFDSCIFPDQNQSKEETRLTVILGGAFHPNLSSSEAEKAALETLNKHLKINISPDYVNTTCYPNAIPQYYVGHQEKIKKFEKLMQERYPFISCIGNSMYGPSVNQCIQTSKKIITSNQLY